MPKTNAEIQARHRDKLKKQKAERKEVFKDVSAVATRLNQLALTTTDTELKRGLILEVRNLRCATTTLLFQIEL